jgi:spore photoproduct lyase
MVNSVYVESDIRDHPRTQSILERFGAQTIIEVDHYGEIFNPNAQNFRIQKNNPSLILAAKQNNRVLAAPTGYGLDGDNHYYFSHMLNCVYDCRYCFLQGMYRSANQIIFVNYDDFISDIKSIASEHPDQTAWFYSGYDCDSLAFDPVTAFTGNFIPALQEIPNARLELRTKSTQIRGLLELEPHANVVTAFSFTDEHSHAKLEHGVPSIGKRINAMKRLMDRGWQIGLRFDPLVYHEKYREGFRSLIESIIAIIDPAKVHSLSLGTFRLTRNHFKKISHLYPEEPLFSQDLELQGGIVSYPRIQEEEMIAWCEACLLEYFPKELYYPCEWHD